METGSNSSGSRPATMPAAVSRTACPVRNRGAPWIRSSNVGQPNTVIWNRPTGTTTFNSPSNTAATASDMATPQQRLEGRQAEKLQQRRDQNWGDRLTEERLRGSSSPGSAVVTPPTPRKPWAETSTMSIRPRSGRRRFPEEILGTRPMAVAASRASPALSSIQASWVWPARATSPVPPVRSGRIHALLGNEMSERDVGTRVPSE